MSTSSDRLAVRNAKSIPLRETWKRWRPSLIRAGSPRCVAGISSNQFHYAYPGFVIDIAVLRGLVMDALFGLIWTSCIAICGVDSTTLCFPCRKSPSTCSLFGLVGDLQCLRSSLHCYPWTGQLGFIDHLAMNLEQLLEDKPPSIRPFEYFILRFQQGSRKVSCRIMGMPKQQREDHPDLKFLNAFHGETWEMEDEVFPNLKFLKLDN